VPDILTMGKLMGELGGCHPVHTQWVEGWGRGVRGGGVGWGGVGGGMDGHARSKALCLMTLQWASPWVSWEGWARGGGGSPVGSGAWMGI
jgi:hypothetical protein